MQILHIYDVPPAGTDDALDMDFIQKELQQVLLRGQTLQVTAKQVNLAECDVCVTALAAARQTAVTVPPGAAHEAVEHEFLSSGAMHGVLGLGDGKAEVFKAAGLALVRPLLSWSQHLVRVQSL